MFDEIICEYPLPGEHAPTSYVDRHPFQTKDLECTLDVYTITSDGRLVDEAYDVEDQSDPNATGWRRAIGCMVKVNRRPGKALDITETIHFYTSNTVGGAPSEDGYVHFTENGEDAESVSYTATFVEGKLVHIKEDSYGRGPGLSIEHRGEDKKRLGELWAERKAAFV
jgi:hypothetical protein